LQRVNVVIVRYLKNWNNFLLCILKRSQLKINAVVAARISWTRENEFFSILSHWLLARCIN